MEREIREFYEKVSRDEDFKKSILLAKEKYSEEKDTLIQLKKIINDVIIPFSKKYGYDFDIEDLLNFERSTNEKKSKLINEASLEDVSGGFSPRINAICLTALLGISSFSGFASNNVANAADHAEASDLIIFSSPEEDLKQELERIKVTLDFCQKNPSAGVGAIRNVLKKGLPRNSNLIYLTAENRDELIRQLYNQKEIISKQRLELLAANSELDLSEPIKEAQKATLSNFAYTHQSDSDSAELLKNINSDTTPRTLGQQIDETTQEKAKVQNWQKEAAAKKSSQQRTTARNMLKQRKCNWEGNTTGEKEGLVSPTEFNRKLEIRKSLLESLRNKLLEIEQTPQKIAEKKQAELDEQERVQKEEAEKRKIEEEKLKQKIQEEKQKEEKEKKQNEEAENLLKEFERARSTQEVIEINKQAKKERKEQEKSQRQEQAKRSQNKIKLETSETQEIGSSGDFKDMFEISNSIINDIKAKAEEKINNLQTVEDCQEEIARIDSDTTLIESTKESLKNLLNLRINYLTQLESIKGLQTSAACQEKIDEINTITELNQNDKGALIKSLVYKKARLRKEEAEQERIEKEKAEQERLEQERLAKEKAEYEAAVPFHANLTNVKKENGSLILEIANNTKTIEISNDIIGAIMKHNNISDFSPRSIDFHLENTDGFKVLRKDGYFGSLRCFNENEGQYSSISLPASDERNILIVTSDGYIRATDLDGKSLDEVTTTKTDIENIQQTYPIFEDNDGLKLDESLSKLNIKIDEKNTLYKDQSEIVHLVSGDNTDANVTNIVEFLGGQLSVEPKSQPISSNEIISEETQATEDNNEITSNPGFFSRMSSKIKSFFSHGE